MNFETALNLLATILPALAVIAGVIYLIVNARKSNKDPAEQKQVEAIIEQLLLGYLTDAERSYGGDTGQLKLSVVLGWLVNALPDKYKTVFSVEQLTAMVEAALRKAKELWKQNPALVGAKEQEHTVAIGFQTDEHTAEDGDE